MDQERMRVLLSEAWPADELDRLVELMGLLIGLPSPPDPDGDFPRYSEYKERFLKAVEGEDPDEVEESFLLLYSHLHMHEARYTKEERERVDETGGYWAHAGGLSPVLKAGPWIHEDSKSMDLGAGNGLQGLLFQVLYPHKKTVQVEISSRMVEIGKRLQEWLNIPDERVEWVIGDVCDQSVEGADFIYLYRPVRPSTEAGRVFYEKLAAALEKAEKQVVVFSIADCLKSFLSSGHEPFYCDGHLTCFKVG